MCNFWGWQEHLSFSQAAVWLIIAILLAVLITELFDKR